MLHSALMCDSFPLGNGAITSDPTVRGQSFSYTSDDPPSFQLVGDSTGGPPTTNYWTRDGDYITNNDSFSINISFTGQHDEAGHRTANYRSTLTVTGRQPGVYQYHVSNNRTNGTRSSRNITIDGNYQYYTIAIAASIIIYVILVPSHNLKCCFPISTILPTHHYLDLLAPINSSMSLLTPTSVNISWIQPVGGLTVDIYGVNLTRTSTGMCSGVGHTREENSTSTSIVIDDLEGNSTYIVTISAMNNQSNAINTTSGLTITTQEAGMFTL